MTTEHKLLQFLTAACLFTTAAAQSTPGAALRLLKVGNQQFVAGHDSRSPLDPGRQRTLAQGQHPFAVVLCCTDSRVSPEHVFNTDLGDLFVVRIAGNVLSSEALASVEYAAEHLGCKLCVVLSHEGCGAIAESTLRAAEARDGQPTATASPALEQLLRAIEPAAQQALDEVGDSQFLNHHAERNHARNTALECLRRSELLRRLHELGNFDVRPARYRLETGKVDWLPTRPLPSETSPRLDRPSATSPTVPPHAALRLLQAGHRRFLNRSQPLGDISRDKRKVLSAAQKPLAVVLSCADSRVVPERIFDSDLGDLCVVRMAGNVLTDEVLASIELAVTQGGAPLLVVMGHSLCETLELSLEHPAKDWRTPHQRALQEALDPVIAASRLKATRSRDLVDLAARANVRRSIEQARARSTVLQQLEAQGLFSMIPALYDLQSGDLQWLSDEATRHAHPLPIAETQAVAQTQAPPTTQSPRKASPAPAPGAAKLEPKPQPTRKARKPRASKRLAPAPAQLREGTNHLAMLIGAIGIASLLGGLWMALRKQD